MINTRRPKFGNRRLSEERDVYEHNAWDNVTWNEEMQKIAEEKLKQNSERTVPLNEQEKYEKEADKFWDKFYEKHQDGFFKDRHWLFTEFPELCLRSTNNSSKTDVYSSSDGNTSTSIDDCSDNSNLQSSKKIVFEVGCGPGNSVFPILEACEADAMFLYCCDFSEVAVSLVKNNPDFDAQRCHPFVLDITSDSWTVPFPACSLDYILLVFVLSAIHPEKMQNVVENLVKYLKPGGKILFRDYGKYDMVELRFKPGHCLSEHHYVRGDGTKVYFFSEEEVHELFIKAGLLKKEIRTDFRLLVNRGKQLTMYRVWIQASYEKPLESQLL